MLPPAPLGSSVFNSHKVSDVKNLIDETIEKKTDKVEVHRHDRGKIFKKNPL